MQNETRKVFKLTESMQYGLALISDGKSDEVRGQVVRALARRGLVAQDRTTTAWFVTAFGVRHL